MRKYLLYLLLSIAFVGCKGDNDDANYSLVAAGQAMPQFTLKSVDGVEFKSETKITQGKVALIYFFASYCDDCHKTTPNVIWLWDKVKDNPDVVLMCIARGGNASLADANAYWDKVSKSLSIPAEQMPTLYYDSEQKVFKQFATQNVPRFYVVGADGRIAWESEGNFSTQTLEQHINTAK